MSRDEAYAALIASDRVSTQTRAALAGRAELDDPAYRPAGLSPAAFVTLRAVVARVLPGAAMDLAQRLDRALAAGAGDGWRFADLPPDREAYEFGLRSLEGSAQAEHRASFTALPHAAQDALLTAMAEQSLPAFAPADSLKLCRWFEDCRGDAVKLYVAHPATLARMGYSGIAYGGDDPARQGFHALGVGERDPWEPIAATDRSP